MDTELIRMALQEIRKTRFRQIELGVFAENAGAVHVYKKLGFEEWGRHYITVHSISQGLILPLMTE